jgi:hypothetical protein
VPVLVSLWNLTSISLSGRTGTCNAVSQFRPLGIPVHHVLLVIANGEWGLLSRWPSLIVQSPNRILVQSIVSRCGNISGHSFTASFLIPETCRFPP